MWECEARILQKGTTVPERTSEILVYLIHLWGSPKSQIPYWKIVQMGGETWEMF